MEEWFRGAYLYLSSHIVWVCCVCVFVCSCAVSLNGYPISWCLWMFTFLCYFDHVQFVLPSCVCSWMCVCAPAQQFSVWLFRLPRTYSQCCCIEFEPPKASQVHNSHRNQCELIQNWFGQNNNSNCNYNYNKTFTAHTQEICVRLFSITLDVSLHYFLIKSPYHYYCYYRWCTNAWLCLFVRAANVCESWI